MKPIIILQQPSETRPAVEVHQSTSISLIRLIRAKLAAPAIDPATDAASQDPISVEFTFRSKALEAPAGILRIEIAFKMTGAQPDSPTPVVSVDCAYAVDYTIIREGFTPSAEQVKAFKDGNAIFNVWPYFREYLQSSLVKMGLPPLTAPFLCLKPKPSSPSTKPATEAKSAGKAVAKNRKPSD